MSLFDKILDALGFGRDVPKTATTPKADRGRFPLQGKPAKPAAPMAAVDVVAKLERLAAKNPQKLNWKRSIVDLLKLLDLESSFEARKALAIELHAPAGVMDDSAAMNTWLHKAVLRKLAENGGNIPKELLD